MTNNRQPTTNNQLPEELRQKIQKLDRRLLPNDLDQIILELCSWRALGLRELAQVLNRSAVYLQNTSLKRLLGQERLQFQFPDQPNHPRQAYRTRKVTPSLIEPISTDSDILSIGIND